MMGQLNFCKTICISDENGEWVQDTSLVQNNQTQSKLANGDVVPAANVTAESAEAAKEASKQVISRYVSITLGS